MVPSRSIADRWQFVLLLLSLGLAARVPAPIVGPFVGADYFHEQPIAAVVEVLREVTVESLHGPYYYDPVCGTISGPDHSVTYDVRPLIVLKGEFPTSGTLPVLLTTFPGYPVYWFDKPVLPEKPPKDGEHWLVFFRECQAGCRQCDSLPVVSYFQPNKPGGRYRVRSDYDFSQLKGETPEDAISMLLMDVLTHPDAFDPYDVRRASLFLSGEDPEPPPHSKKP